MNNILGLLTVLFVGLKLAGIIAWSWWWVVSPLIFGVALTVVVIATIIISAMLLR